MLKPRFVLSILLFISFLSSCTTLESQKKSDIILDKELIIIDQNINKQIREKTKNQLVSSENQKKIKLTNTNIKKDITFLFSDHDDKKIVSQFINIIELGIHDKKLLNTKINFKFFENKNQLRNIILNENNNGKIYSGLINSSDAKIASEFCDTGAIFFSFSSDISNAGECMYLINFFPKNELQQLFNFLDNRSKVALLFPQNKYGYLINSLVDEVAYDSDAIIINRSSYNADLSDVRDSIKELGRYELRKYELDRQKKLLKTKTDDKSKKRLKKLEKFKTTNDYNFTHVLIADYGLNLLQVAPLLPYYDIDPNIVQFMGTGVIDDQMFFFEPSLQNAIFPGIQKTNRIKLLKRYSQIYDDNFIRISTLPYDLVGLLNYIISENLSLEELYDLLDNSKIKFDGVDGSFYFKDNIIERKLDILKIKDGNTFIVK